MILRTGGAQVYTTTPGVQVLGAGGGAALAGAYDAIPNIAAAYGMRRLRGAYTGNLLRLRRSSDSAESDFGYDANGDLDAAAIVTWLGGGSGLVVTWYDQSGGNYHATQSTAANQPLYVASGQNGKPVARFQGTNDTLATADSVALSTLTVLAVFRASAHGLVYEHSADSNSNDGSFIYTNNDPTMNLRRTNRTAKALTAAWGLGGTMRVVAQEHGGTHASHKLYINSVDQTLTTFALLSNDVGAGTATARLWLGSRGGTGLFLTGDIAEFVAMSPVLSDGERQAVEAIANSYWSVY